MTIIPSLHTTLILIKVKLSFKFLFKKHFLNIFTSYNTIKITINKKLFFYDRKILVKKEIEKKKLQKSTRQCLQI